MRAGRWTTWLLLGGVAGVHAQQAPDRFVPAWWQHPWVILPGMLLAAAVAWLWARWQRRELHVRHARMEQQLAARTAELARSAAALAEARAQLEELSIRDPLTGLFNRRHLLSLAPELQGRHSCVLIDLDHFKHINDRFGQAEGDRVLKLFGAQMAQSAAGSSPPLLCGRYGGAEFLVFLPGRDRFTAAHWADQLRQQWAGTLIALPDGSALRCTASLGVAEREAGEPQDAWIARADGALYTAKHRGRDRIEIAG